MAGAKPPGKLPTTVKPVVSKEREVADLALDPLAGGAFVATTFAKLVFGPIELSEAFAAVRDRAAAIRSNNLASVEDTLTAQAVALNAVFLDLVLRSGANISEHPQAADAYMRLALKAQGQCRATLETLANIKNPPVVYARQANIAAGPQQVNNGVGASPASESTSAPNELLETEHGKRLEPKTEGAAIGGDPVLEAVGAIDGAADGGRQGARQPQRRKGRKAARPQG